MFRSQVTVPRVRRGRGRGRYVGNIGTRGALAQSTVGSTFTDFELADNSPAEPESLTGEKILNFFWRFLRNFENFFKSFRKF